MIRRSNLHEQSLTGCEHNIKQPSTADGNLSDLTQTQMFTDELIFLKLIYMVSWSLTFPVAIGEHMKCTNTSSKDFS